MGRQLSTKTEVIQEYVQSYPDAKAREIILLIKRERGIVVNHPQEVYKAKARMTNIPKGRKMESIIVKKRELETVPGIEWGEFKELPPSNGHITINQMNELLDHCRTLGTDKVIDLLGQLSGEGK